MGLDGCNELLQGTLFDQFSISFYKTSNVCALVTPLYIIVLPLSPWSTYWTLTLTQDRFIFYGSGFVSVFGTSVLSTVKHYSLVASSHQRHNYSNPLSLFVFFFIDIILRVLSRCLLWHIPVPLGVATTHFWQGFTPDAPLSSIKLCLAELQKNGQREGMDVRNQFTFVGAASFKSAPPPPPPFFQFPRVFYMYNNCILQDLRVNVRLH